MVPDPFVPLETDVSGMPGFVMNVSRLLASDLVALGRPEQKWAALMLWCRAFLQSPPGSLPDDDNMLAMFSGDPSNWKKLRPVALRGWVKCSDGRLYHGVLAEHILIAAAFKLRQQSDEKTPQAERQARWRATMKETSRRLRELGVSTPKGASLETMRRLLVDAERRFVDANEMQPNQTNVDDEASVGETTVYRKRHALCL